jgi:hypothetical protein
MYKSTGAEDPSMTVSVTRSSKAERVEEEFEEWVSGVITAASRSPGQLDAEVFKPDDPADTEYRIIFKFDRMSNLKRSVDPGASDALLCGVMLPPVGKALLGTGATISTRPTKASSGAPPRRVLDSLRHFFMVSRLTTTISRATERIFRPSAGILCPITCT